MMQQNDNRVHPIIVFILIYLLRSLIFCDYNTAIMHNKRITNHRILNLSGGVNDFTMESFFFFHYLLRLQK